MMLSKVRAQFFNDVFGRFAGGLPLTGREGDGSDACVSIPADVQNCVRTFESIISSAQAIPVRR